MPSSNAIEAFILNLSDSPVLLNSFTSFPQIAVCLHKEIFVGERKVLRQFWACECSDYCKGR